MLCGVERLILPHFFKSLTAVKIFFTEKTIHN